MALRGLDDKVAVAYCAALQVDTIFANAPSCKWVTFTLYYARGRTPTACSLRYPGKINIK
jgi:hypothetical protein